MNHQWMRTSWQFDVPMCNLTLGYRDAMRLGFVKVLAKADTNVDEVSEAVTRLIETIRPDLKGGILIGMCADFPKREYQFCFAHPSLPKAEQGCHLVRVPLLPQADEPN